MKRSLTVVGILIAVVLVVLVALPFLVDANQFRPRLETELSQHLGRDVKIGNLGLSLLSGGVSASDIRIAEDPKFGNTPFLSAKSLGVSVDLGALIFSRKLDVTGITIEQPAIMLLENRAGTWNFASLGGNRSAPPPQAGATSGPSSLNLSVKLVKVANGKIVLGRIGSTVTPEVLEKVNVEIRDLSATAAVPFSITAAATGGAQIKMQGSAGPLNSANTAATPFNASLQITHLDLAHSGFLPATGFAGLVTVDGTVNSTGTAATVKGAVKGERLVLAKGGTPATKPVTFDFEVQHDLEKHAGTLRRGDVHIGAAAASVTGTYHGEGELTLLNVKVLAPAMAIPELEGMLPSLAIVLPAGSSLQGGTVNVDMTAVGPTQALVLDGSLRVSNTRLAGFDLGNRMSLVTKLAGIKNGPNTEIQNFSSNVHSDAQGRRFDNISLIAPEVGELNGNGTMSPAQALDFKMTAKLHGGGVLAAVGSNTDVPFRIQGTASEPKFEPDVKAVMEEKLKSLTTGDKTAKEAQGIIKGLFGGKKN